MSNIYSIDGYKGKRSNRKYTEAAKIIDDNYGINFKVVNIGLNNNSNSARVIYAQEYHKNAFPAMPPALKFDKIFPTDSLHTNNQVLKLTNAKNLNDNLKLNPQMPIKIISAFGRTAYSFNNRPFISSCDNSKSKNKSKNYKKFN